MAIYHPIINIDINKGYVIREHDDKPAEVVAQKVRELSEDKTNWSKKVQMAIQRIIRENGYDLPDDLLIPLNNSTKTLNISLDRPMNEYSREELVSRMRNSIDGSDNDADAKAASIEEVYMGLNGKYQVFDDVKMAQIVLLLSKMAVEASTLWVTITFRLKEIKDAIFHFSTDTGKVRLSERAYQGLSKEEIMRAHGSVLPYINMLNQLIEGKRELPSDRS